MPIPEPDPSQDDRLLGDLKREHAVGWEKFLARFGLPKNIGITVYMTLGEAKAFAARKAPNVASEHLRKVDEEVSPAANRGKGKMPTLQEKALQVLKNQQAVASLSEQSRFVDELLRSIQKREDSARRCSQIQKGNEIIDLIQKARDEGDMDEAVWRCFLAAHFGVSACPCVEEEIYSASQLLCAFKQNGPYWTWERVASNPPAFRQWLSDHANDLQTLSYGNHRKYESKKPDGIWEVVESFLAVSQKFGGPWGVVSFDPPEPPVAHKFDRLYYRIREIWHFGRTGAFDFLVLLNDLKVIEVEPRKCYLVGATGPMDGAKLLWGNRPDEELERLAADFAHLVEVSPIAVEDALCNWQK